MKEKIKIILKKDQKKIFIVFIILIVILCLYITVFNKKPNSNNNQNSNQVESNSGNGFCDLNLSSPDFNILDPILDSDNTSKITNCYNEAKDKTVAINVKNFTIKGKAIRIVVGFDASELNNSIKIFIGDALAYTDSSDPLYIAGFSIFNNELFVIAIGKSTNVGYSNVFAFDKDGKKVFQLATDDSLYNFTRFSSTGGTAGKGLIKYEIFDNNTIMTNGCGDSVLNKTIDKEYEMSYLGNGKFSNPQYIKDDICTN